MKPSERADVLNEIRELRSGGYDRDFAEAELRRYFPQARFRGVIDHLLSYYYYDADENAA